MSDERCLISGKGVAFTASYDHRLESHGCLGIAPTRNVSINYTICLGRKAMAASRDVDSTTGSMNEQELSGQDLSTSYLSRCIMLL